MPDKTEPLSEEWFHALTVDDREFSTQDGCKRVLLEAVAEALEWALEKTSPPAGRRLGKQESMQARWVQGCMDIRAKANEFRNATL